MVEFTGERVIPGQVDADLWNEHFARYAFASRLSRRKRVLDAGCGTGYGTAELARAAATVFGVDISASAVDYARQHYLLPNLRFLRGSCEKLPFRSGSFDLVVAFEVIEHLKQWQEFLAEVRRLLAPGAQCIISTPNKDYYNDSRGSSGPNPYHEHEFTAGDFSLELSKVFPHVSLFLQNHAEGFVFHPARAVSKAEARVESGAGNPPDAHFFLAVCALAPQTGAPTFLYLPKVSNVLREREQHISKLDDEVAAKDQAIAKLTEDRDKLIALFRQQQEELEERNRWAELLNGKVEQAGGTILKLQGELEEKALGYEAKIAQLEAESQEQALGYQAKVAQLEKESQEQAQGYEAKIAQLEQESQQQAQGYEARIAELEEDSRGQAERAVETERRLTSELAEKFRQLTELSETLHKDAKTAEERTTWVLNLQNQVRELEARLTLIRGSRWLKLGNALGMGPRLRDE